MKYRSPNVETNNNLKSLNQVAESLNHLVPRVYEITSTDALHSQRKYDL